MTDIEKIQLLKLLYQHRAMGHEYFEEYQSLLKTEPSSLAHSMEELKKDVLACHLCTLAKSRKNILFGDGNPKADIMFIGDNPGVSEDEMGTLFAGRSGEMLVNMIEKVLLLPKEEVYITTILKCRPPENRTPFLSAVPDMQPPGPFPLHFSPESGAISRANRVLWTSPDRTFCRGNPARIS